MTTVLYCENAPYAQNHSIGFEQTQEIDLTNNILFTPIDLLYLQFLADVSLGDCEKSTHCTQPSSTTVTAIEDLRSAIAKVKATAASKEDLAKADVSLGDCEKSTHCTQPSSTTVTAIEDLRSAIAKVKATAASKEDLAKVEATAASKEDLALPRKRISLKLKLQLPRKRISLNLPLNSID